MLVSRCEWHRQYWGYVAYVALKPDGRWRWATTGSICSACAAVVRAQSRGVASTATSVKREIGRAAMALTGVAAWLLVMLLFAGGGR